MAKDIRTQPYADFLEEMLGVLNSMDEVTSIAVTVMTPDREVSTGYWNTTPTDLAVFAHYLQADGLREQIEDDAEQDEEDDDETSEDE